MRKKKYDFNVVAISKRSNIVVSVIIGIIAISCITPYLIAFLISFASKSSIDMYGYQLIPSAFSLESYKILSLFGTEIRNAYLTTIFVVVVGTVLVLLITTTYGYVISRRDFRWSKHLTFYVFLTMLFSAGMVPNYMIITRVLNLKNTVWALIVPALVNPYWIIIAKTFFQMTVPKEIIESAKIDGATEMTIYRKIVMPVSLPVIATIGLFSTIGYWNSWFEAMLYIDVDYLNSLQYLLIRIQANIDFLIKNASLIGPEAQSMVQNLPKQSFMMALMVVSTLPLVLAYPYFQRYIVGGLTIGSVK
ncbi:carbohydrate ABC transporter permease [Vallitalea pronyensis]|uniref:Carbohydrate ABC transporter permease n=1 Tax=Vallitalea pronyensis TaxID=1348613 RepID=A0A8J8SG68_9FIRM|nr:carbohydrate ABC transporter permease [Vallitalea pronyensis]QUI22079.1 carbohydrate ABC transporter permease [Vallitalea pronyensis]